jgi:hypothetical protein
MPTEQFETIWLPRIGGAATELLWRDQRFRVAELLIVLVGVVGGPAFIWSLGAPSGCFSAS